MRNIFEMHKTEIEYPERKLLLNGVKQDSKYCYVSNTYLNGFINYVDIISAAMIYDYAGEDEWNTFCENVDNLKDKYHTNVSDSDKFDTIVILGKSEDSYWIFVSDRDNSDCSITRLYKEAFKNDDKAIKCFKASLSIFAEQVHPDDAKFKEIPTEYFKGWVTI